MQTFTEEAWLPAQASIKKSVLGIGYLVLQQPSWPRAAAQLPDTHDPDVTVAETHFRPSVREVLRGAGTARHAPRATCLTSATHTYWTPR